ncbi:HAMP domain-containing sensor histidine kinase [Gallaecimonas sp. GXIMD4217]|uniref:sensor histidine kinase n=1 Tax=Gallaecimonas sp. GXIMD4217 TaxID=3131927 RepID=UPI00311AC3D1
MINSPRWRYYLLLLATLLLLSFSLQQLYEWLTVERSPLVDSRLVLDAVQQADEQGRPLSCEAGSSPDCSEALFVRYPPGYWGGQQLSAPGEVIALSDSRGRGMFCSVDERGGMLCLNRINWPGKRGFTLDFAYLFYFCLLLALILLSRGIFRDLEILRSSALEEIRFGKFPSFTLSPRSYLAPLAQSLGNLTERIEQLNRFQAEVAETVCHDIKTPLSRMRFISHMLAPDNLDSTKKQLAQNIGEIEQNVYDYLRLAQNDYSEQEPSRQLLQLRPYLQQLLEPFGHHGDKAIELSIERELAFEADGKLLSRAINNLLVNALRFARHLVRVRAELAPGQLLISVEDDGPGWQSGGRHQGSDAIAEHHGLGLAIVRRVMEQHGGRLVMASAPGGGTRASLILPRP